MKVLDIQGRQMNSSIVTIDRIFIGCRDRRIFVFNKFNFELVKMIEVPDSVHCMCALHDYTQVAAGMSDGHLMVLELKELAPNQPAEQSVSIINAAHLGEVGGIWSICGVNGDKPCLALRKIIHKEKSKYIRGCN